MQNTRRAREVRLGLVLYGGVSLCIYENGIVQEIYRAICGNGLYRLIGELIDSDIVVDVISGTSAGGVNGVMLAYALATKSDFAQTATRWRELGDIEKLLRGPDDDVDTSLLNSTYYQQELARCYAALKESPYAAAPDIEELDLFVTGTDAYGVISTVYDDLGHPIDVKNHRALFQLQYRGARKNDFDRTENKKNPKHPIPVTPEDMATLSRLTSGFPVAFEPIRIGAKHEAPNFHRWGKLSGPAVYMDGGILNNKPFTSTISAIASRTATREVERFLIYVEPRPERFEKPTQPPITPTVVEAGLWSLTSIPSYQSIAADLEAVEAHNERSLKVQKIIENLPKAPHAGLDCLNKAKIVPEHDDPCGAGSYLTARLLLMMDAAVETILNSPDGQRDFLPTKEAQEAANKRAGKPKVEVIDKRRSGRLLVQSFWQWEPDPDNPDKTLVDYDVFYRKRRVDHLSGALMAALKSDRKPLDVPRQTWEAVNHFFKLYEITEWAMRTWVTRWKESGWEDLSKNNLDLDSLEVAQREERLKGISRDLWKRAQDRLDRLMNAAIAVPPFDFDPDADSAKARKTFYDNLRDWIEKPVDGTEPNLLVRLDDSLIVAIQLLENAGPTAETGQLLRDEFCRFLEVDRQLLPVQIGSGFESTNVIRVVRFSPMDAQRGLSQGPVEDKVSGTALANFGAFFKKSWRAKDIMMGRFDAVCLLTECLLTKERLAAMVAMRGIPDPAAVKKLVAESLPNAAPGLTASINTYFREPTPAHWETMITAIVLAGQQEIEAAERPVVAKCALEQQYAWGQYQAEKCLPEELKFPDKSKSGKASPDQLLVSIAANAICEGKLAPLPPFNPAKNAHRDFLDEVPATAMQEHVALGLVRLGKSLLASIPEGKFHDQVEENLIFKLPMQWLPAFFYRLVHTRRTQPDWLLVPIAVFLNLALLAVLVFAWMPHGSHEHSLTYSLLATVGVAAAVVAEWVLTRDNVLKAIGVIVVVVLILAAAGLWAGYWRFGPVTDVQRGQSLFAIKCLVSILVIATSGMVPLKSFVSRLVIAALAGAVLLQMIWK